MMFDAVRGDTWLGFRNGRLGPWDSNAQLVQDRADQRDALGLFDTFKDLRARGASVHLGGGPTCRCCGGKGCLGRTFSFDR